MSKFTVLIILFLATLMHPNSVGAQEKKGLEVSPAYSEVILEKEGAETKFELTYTNHTDHALSLDLTPIDFKQTDYKGEISFVTEQDSYSYSLSSFLSFESNTLELAPGETKKFKITITNRPDISPGGHYAAVVGKFRQVSPNDNTVNSQVVPSISSLILLRKTGGENFSMSLIGSDFPSKVMGNYPLRTTLTFRNEGNVHLIPYGVVYVKDFFGRTVAKGTINTSSHIVMPESRKYIDVNFHEVDPSFPISFNTVTLYGQDSLKKVGYTYQQSYLYVNSLFAGVSAISILAVIIYVIYRFRVKK